MNERHPSATLRHEIFFLSFPKVSSFPQCDIINRYSWRTRRVLAKRVLLDTPIGFLNTKLRLKHGQAIDNRWRKENGDHCDHIALKENSRSVYYFNVIESTWKQLTSMTATVSSWNLGIANILKGWAFIVKVVVLEASCSCITFLSDSFCHDFFFLSLRCWGLYCGLQRVGLRIFAEYSIYFITKILIGSIQ